MRQFESGATRDTDANKIDYEGFLSPQVLRRYGEYMLKHQKQADGQMRASDNWQKGIPRDAYMKSMMRHMFEVWEQHRGHASFPLETACSGELQNDVLAEKVCALLFNVMGYLYELENGR